MVLCLLLVLEFERLGISRRGLHLLESRHPKLEFEPNFDFFRHK